MSEYLEHAEKAEASSAQQKEQNPAIAAQAQTPELSHNWKRIIVTIWIGQAFSILTAYSSMYAGVWYVTEPTDSAFMLAVASLCSMLPQGLLSPIGGVIADRFNRKYVLMAADAFVGAMALIMGMIIMMGHVSVELVLIMSALRSVTCVRGVYPANWICRGGAKNRIFGHTAPIAGLSARVSQR